MISRSAELIAECGEVRPPGGDARSSALAGGRRRPLARKTGASRTLFGLGQILPARRSVLAQTEAIFARRLMFRSGLAQRQKNRPDMIAEPAAGESPALAEDMDPSLRHPRPIDPYPQDLRFLTVDSLDARPRPGAVDFDVDAAGAETLGSAFPLLRLEMRTTPLVERHRLGGGLRSARPSPTSAFSAPGRGSIVHSSSLSTPHKLFGLARPSSIEVFEQPGDQPFAVAASMP